MTLFHSHSVRTRKINAFSLEGNLALPDQHHVAKIQTLSQKTFLPEREE